MSRKRSVYIAATIAVIGLGLASRKWSILGKYPGNALWALIFFLWGVFQPRISTMRLATYALVTSYAGEFSQSDQAPWINSIRLTTLGHLILGSTFSGRDMASYTAGVLA